MQLVNLIWYQENIYELTPKKISFWFGRVWSITASLTQVVDANYLNSKVQPSSFHCKLIIRTFGWFYDIQTLLKVNYPKLQFFNFIVKVRLIEQKNPSIYGYPWTTFIFAFIVYLKWNFNYCDMQLWPFWILLRTRNTVS